MAAFRTATLTWMPALVAGVVYLGLLAWIWHHFHGNPLGFVHLGTIWREHNPRGTWGYDGQFYYYIALHPMHAAAFLDNAPYRLQRIGYPLLIIAGSAGRRAWMPLAMLLINWLAVIVSTAAVAGLLSRWGRNPWFALAYAGASGVPVALTFDTPEILACAFAAVAVACWDRLGEPGCEVPPAWLAEGTIPNAASASRAPPKWSGAAGSAAFAAALLTRELMGLFLLAYGGAALPRRDWPGLLRVVLAGLPLVLWIAYLSLTYHTLSLAFAPAPEPVPFRAFALQLSTPTPRAVGYAAQYIVPTVVFGVLALAALRRTWRAPAPLLLAVLGQILLLVFLPAVSYHDQVAVSRIALGLALAAVLWAGQATPRWILWLTPLFAGSLLGYGWGLLSQDPAYLW